MKSHAFPMMRKIGSLALAILTSSIWGGGLLPSHAISPSISPWETILSADTEAGAESDAFPETVVSGQTIHTVWSSWIGFEQHFLSYRRSADGGATWQNRVVLGAYGDDWQNLREGKVTRLAVDGNRVHVVQRRRAGSYFDLEYFRSTDGGATFEPGRSILRGPNGWVLESVRISAENGKVAVAYSLNHSWTTNPTGWMLLSQNQGDTFASLSAVPNSYGPYPWDWGSINCVDLRWIDGRITSIWRTNGTMPFVASTTNIEGTACTWVNLSTANTESWAPPEDVMRAQLVAVTGSTIHMAWNHRNPAGRSAMFYARSTDGGATFESGRDLSEGTIGTEEVRGGRVAMVAQGSHVYVCYVANASGGLWLRTSDDSGATFGSAVPLHLPDTLWYGNGECPTMALDPRDATGAAAWFAFAIPSPYGGASASAVRHTHDGGNTLSPLLMPANPYVWGNSYPRIFQLCPLVGDSETAWSMIYTGTRSGADADVYFRPLAPECSPQAGGNQVLHFAGRTFSDRSDMLQVPSAPALQFSNAVTAELWVKANPVSSPGGWGMEILQWGETRSLGFRCVNDGLTVQGLFRTTAGSYALGSGVPLGDRGWHHLAISYDANAGPMNLRLYVDGHLDHAVTATGSFVPPPQPLMIGGPPMGESSRQLFSGDVDNLRLWSRTLSEDEIRASAAQATVTGSEPGLAAAYSFDGSVKDLTGHDGDGMLQYGVTYITEAVVRAAVFTEWTDDFATNALLSPYWQSNPGSPLFTTDTTHGDLRVAKPVGTTGGPTELFTLNPRWRALGDFDVSIDFRDAVLTRSRDRGNHLGLRCTIGTTVFYFYRSDESGPASGQNVRLGTSIDGQVHGVRYTTATSGNLRMTRHGNQLSMYLDAELIAQNPCGTEPMTCQLDLLNNGTPDAISATFDNFKLSASTLEPLWNSFATYLIAKGLTGAAADPLADPDGDGVPNLLEYATGTDARFATSVPHPLVTGTEGTNESGRFLTVTMQLAKPVPVDLDITGEFTMDLGMDPWMFTGIIGTDADHGDHIDRTFRAPMMIGFPPTGFIRVKITER